jgi:hypothetical protein
MGWGGPLGFTLLSSPLCSFVHLVAPLLILLALLCGVVHLLPRVLDTLDAKMKMKYEYLLGFVEVDLFIELRFYIGGF